MRSILLCIPLAMSLAMAGYGWHRVQEGAVLFDFSVGGVMLGFISMLVGGYGLFGRQLRQRSRERFQGILLLRLVLFIGGFGAIWWHGVNLRLSKANYESLRQDLQRVEPLQGSFSGLDCYPGCACCAATLGSGM